MKLNPLEKQLIWSIILYYLNIITKPRQVKNNKENPREVIYQNYNDHMSPSINSWPWLQKRTTWGAFIKPLAQAPTTEIQIQLVGSRAQTSVFFCQFWKSTKPLHQRMIQIILPESINVYSSFTHDS